MTDIVERLRSHEPNTWNAAKPLILEAADEIERLRQLGYENGQQFADALEAKDTEIVRLRDCNVELETRRNDAWREVERLKEEKAKAESYMDQFAAEANRLREALQNALEYGVTSRNIASLQAALSQKEGV